MRTENKIVEIGGEKYYVGLAAIAKRLGWKCAHTVRRHILASGLLAIKGHVPGGHSRKRGPVWYTSDSLLMAWQIAQSKISRDAMKKQKIATWPDRRYVQRRAAREKAVDTRVAVGPNGDRSASNLTLINESDNTKGDKDDAND